MNFSVLKFLLIIFVILGIHFAFVVAEAENEPEEPTSEEFENVLIQNLRNNYNKGCTEMLTFFQTLNKTIADLAQQVANLEAKSNSNFQAIRTDVNSSNTQLTAKIDILQKELVELKTNTNNNNTGLTIKLDNVDSTAKNSSLRLAFVARNLSWTGFDEIVQMKPAVQTGKSFNGSDLSTIKSRVARAGADGQYTVVVFVNHLDKAITDFKVYNEYNITSYNVGPASIPAHTKEIFTFAAVPQQRCRHIAFSYAIPASNVRIAALSWDAGDDEGLAFVHKNTDMKSYLDSKQGITGSSDFEDVEWVDRNLSVGYQNYYARMFMDSEGNRRGTLSIDLIELP